MSADHPSQYNKKKINYNNKRKKTKVGIYIFLHINLSLHSRIHKAQTKENTSAVTLCYTHTHQHMHTEYEIEKKTCLHTPNKPTQRNAQKHTYFFTLGLLLHITDVQSNGTDGATGTSSNAHTRTHNLAAPRGTHRQFVVVFACRPWSERLWAATENKDKRRRRSQRGDWR